MEDTELGELFWCYIAAGVVGLALVALAERLEIWGWRVLGGGCTGKLSNQYALIVVVGSFLVWCIR